MTKLLFRASVSTFNKEFLKELNTVLFNVLWKGKDKIKRLGLIREYSYSVLKMPHLEYTIKTRRTMCLEKYMEDY